MFRRNFNTRSRYSRGGFRRRGTGLRIAKAPQRWEWCNLALTIENFIDQLNPNATIVTNLASVVFGVADRSDGSGRALSNAVRWLEIGGLVADWYIEPTSFDDTPSTSPLGQRWQHQVLVVSDRIDSSGSPAAIPDWFSTGSPTVVVSTSTPPTVNEDVDYPLRIHYRKAVHYNRSFEQSGSGNSVWPTTQVVQTLSGHLNKRLKLKLDDTTGLYLHFASLASNINLETEWTWNLRFTGTLYYRWRF